MNTTYLRKLADVLINYSLEIKPGDILRITAGPNTLPLFYEAYRAAIHAGGFVVPRLTDPTFNEILLREGSVEQLQFVSPLLRHEIETTGKWLDFLCDTNVNQFSSIDPERYAIKQRANKVEQQLFNQRAATGLIRHCTTLYPTDAYAQEAGMSLMEYAEFVFQSCLLNEPDPAAAWQRMHNDQQRIVDFLDSRSHIRIVSPGTELEYRCAGRKWLNYAGKENFPDGEVSTAPIEDSVYGHMEVSYPSVHNGGRVEGVDLVFENGKLVRATARQGQEFLDGQLNIDPGARYVGEVAFGTNYGITRATGHGLFDEKIGGTMHLALGWSYPEAGGKNESQLHWDFVADLHEGEAYADGELFYKAGRFLI